MKTQFYSAKVELKDEKAKNDRRFRNILANSGEIMESGEVRELDDLYVMGRDGNLIKISDLNPDPEKQTENYSVKAQADHGELIDGELVPSIEKQFGSCRVWLGKDGLHARMYFADNDKLADHAWAISEDASYSTGIDWYPDGYYGTGYEIDHAIGILREISMVLTGNDPRALTIDHKPKSEAVVRRNDEQVDGINNNKKGNDEMSETKDELTREESAILKEQIVEAVDKVTADIPESETEPTRASKDEEAAEEAKEEQKDTLRSPVIVIRDKVAKQEMGNSSKAYLQTDKAVAAWGKALLDAKGDAKAWRDNFRKIAKQDGVDFGEDVTIAPEAVINAVASQLEDEDTLFSHVNKTGLAFEIVAIPTEEDGGMGHKNGQTKVEENISGQTRVLTPADIYKLMKLDHSMVKLNGGIASSAIVRYVLRELPRKLVETIDKAILVGGVKNEDGSDFTALNPILADIAGEDIYGVEYTAVAGENARQTVAKAANKVTSSADRTLICTPDYFADLENATTEGGQLLFPNGIAKGDPRINGIRRIITPLWLTEEMLGDYDAVVVDLSNYHTVGDSTPENFTDYDIDVNKYVWEAVACIGGGLANKNAAVGIKAAA